MAINAAKDVSSLLQTNSYGTEGTDIFVNSAPDPPANCIEINDTGGLPPSDAMGTDGASFLRPGVQIKVRNTSNSSALTSIWNIFNLLHKYSGTIDSVNYKLIVAVQQPFLLYKDENERYTYCCNFLVERAV